MTIMETISVDQLRAMLSAERADNVLIVDVRTPGEFKSERLLGVANIPLDELEKHKAELERYQHIYVHCASGNRSGQACEKLQNLGLNNIINVEGGLQAWKDAGFPLVEGRGTIPIMRQVQIAAGSLVVGGVVLSRFVHPRFILLSAGVGAGLIYAGSSGNCMMAEVLGRMPWNR